MLTKIKSSKRAKLRLLAFVPVLLSVLLVFACQQTEKDDMDSVGVKKTEVRKSADGDAYFEVEDMPVYPGGNLALRKFIAMHIAYPEVAKEQGVQGVIYVQFVVNKMGEVEKVKVVESRIPDVETERNEVGEIVVVGYGNKNAEMADRITSLEEEAVRVVSKIPTWTPGYQDGKAVNVSFTVPIKFQLN